MTSVYERDRRWGWLWAGAYLGSSLLSVAAVFLAWSAAVRPPKVVVWRVAEGAQVVEHTKRPSVTATVVETFAQQFAEAVGIEDAKNAEVHRQRVMSTMLSIELAEYERSPEKAEEAVRHASRLESQRLSGRLASAESTCRPLSQTEWACVVRAEALYRWGTAVERVRRRFIVQMTVEAVRVTARSPYGFLVTAFEVDRAKLMTGSNDAASGVTTLKPRGADAARAEN